MKMAPICGANMLFHERGRVDKALTCWLPPDHEGIHECAWPADPINVRPRLALRPEAEHGPHNAAAVLLDDVVVTDVVMFRAEFMDDNDLWMRCYLANNEEIDFQVSAKRAKLRLIATDLPGSFDDFDAAGVPS